MKYIKKRTGRIVAMLLVLAMIVTSVPQYALTASAAETTKDAAIAEEHDGEEIAADAGTEVKAAEAAEKEEETAVTQTEDAEAADETETAATEAETSETAVTEAETGKDSQTEVTAETEAGTDAATEQETEGSESEESESDDVLAADDDTEVGKQIVTINIPYNLNGPTTENLLEEFKYAVYSSEPADEEISLKSYEGSFDDLIAEYQSFYIEVPVNGVLYFEPVIKDIAELESVNCSYEGAVTPDENGVYKISNVQNDFYITMNATRYYCIVFQADHAKFYESEEDKADGKELTECRMSDGEKKTIFVEPEEGYAFSTIDSSSNGIKVTKEKYPRNSCIVSVLGSHKAPIKDPVTIYATAEILNEYEVTFDWPVNDLDVSVNDEELLTQDNKTITVTEGNSIYFIVKPKDNTKSVFVEYTEEATGETIVPGFNYYEDGTYDYNIGEGDGILGNISVKISVADYHTITFKTESKYIGGFEYRYKGSDTGDGSVDFDPVDETSDVPIERTYSIQAPDGYELQFWSYLDTEYGSLTASTEQGELNRKGSYDEFYFAITPTDDMTVTLDVKPEKFTVNADEGVEFSICRYDDDQEAYVDMELSDDNSIYYYNSMDEVRLKVRKEDRKRYKVSGEIHDYDIWIETFEDMSNEEDEYAYYELNIGYCKKAFIESYETVTLTLVRSDEISSQYVRKLHFYEDEEGNKEWDFDVLEESEGQVTADKDRDCFIGVCQNDDVYRYKLNYTNTAGDISGSLVFYEKLEFTNKYGNKEEWTIYKFVPTADMTVTIEAIQLEKYTVTVVLGDSVTSLYAAEEYFDSEGTLEDITENSKILINNIRLQDNANIRKVEFETDGGTRQLASADYTPDGVDYRIKITGNTTIYVSAVPTEEFTLKFDNTDGYDVKIWEAGNYGSFENDSFSLTNNQITLENNKEYLFDILPEDGYLAESVVATDESGKETLIERTTSEDGKAENEGYRVGTGYGNTEDFTIKVNLKAAYTLNFDMESASELEVYSWEDWENRINEQRIAIPAEDGYPFYIPEFNEAQYKISVRESDSFALTKDYRTINEEYRYPVYTVAAKKNVTQLSKTATIVIEPSTDIYEITIAEYPVQIKNVYISYYNYSDGWYSDSYKITDGKAAVSGTTDNVVQVNPMKGYTAKVIMKGESGGESELKQIRNDSGLLDYWIGELTEDKTIEITAVRDTTTYYSVGFVTRNAVIRDSEYKLPYASGAYYSDGEIDVDCSYQIARGRSISFIAEPDYGYKVESVSVRDELIEPDTNGVYTVKPTRDETAIIVRTVKSDNPDEPDNPDNPDEPDNPAKNAVVKFTYPAQVGITVNEYNLENNQISVPTGKQISFTAEVTDKDYEIKSVTAGGVEIPVDTATGTYTITINADTEIIITAGKKQEEPQPEKKYTVRFTHPQFVSVAVSGVQTDSVNDVADGTNVSFSVTCMDENYQIKSVKANGADVAYDTGAGSYVLTVTADTEVVIETEQKPNVDTNAPTAVKVQGVSNKGELNLSQQNRKYTITLTPADADGSVFGVKVNPENSVIKASIVSETRGSRVIYYLSLEKPETSVGDTAEVTIYNTKTGEAISGGTIKVITRAPSTEEPDTSGLKVTFEGYDETETPSYTYTGSAITPWIEVTYNGEYLEQGTDYIVKCANNINVSTDAKPAKLTITGKGSLAGKHDYTFKITPKDIGDTYDVKAGSVKVVKGAKATPVLVYNGMVLGKKDFDNPKAAEKFSADSTITLTGKGNYTGTRDVKVEVVDKGQLNKISIKLDNAINKNLAYDGTEKYPKFQVFDAKKAEITNKENEAYIVVYPEDIVSAGTVKFTVVGIGDYTGTVTKSYKIKPSVKSESDIVVSSPSSGGYTYVSTGVTEYEPDVTLKDGTWLEKGKDYTLAYSNNKKAGTARCKINFIGNYKGVKAITKEFTIKPFNITDFDEDNIIVADLTSGGKPGTYKSVPYIIDNEANALIKSSEFKFTYYVNEAMTTEMKEKLSSGKVWVKIEPKNADKGNYTGSRTVSYTIRESGTDLSKAKVTFDPNKPAYTGSALTPTCSVELNKMKLDNSNNNKYYVRYLSNVYKGKATVIITGADGSDYVGSKTATFIIAASDIKDIK